MPALPKACGPELPEFGFVRINQIIGDEKRGIPPIIPVSKDAWYALIREGKVPRPIKLGARTAVWRIEDIRRLVDDISRAGGLIR